MPYEIRREGDRWKVVNSETGDVKGEHATETKAKAQLRALYVHVPDAEKEIAANDLPGVNLVGAIEPEYSTITEMVTPSSGSSVLTTDVEKSIASASKALFVPITKVDLERREVWGYACLEEPDHSGEIMDYASSKPYFVDWSEAQKRRSNGQSLGNLRAMHDRTAAGKLIAFNADDKAKGFYVGAKVVDDDEWSKVAEGVYTGFSIGGSYIRRWPDERPGLVRYTAGPGELSLVDAPCVEGATFDVVKADGITVKKKFHGGIMAELEKEMPTAPEAIADVPLANSGAVYNEPGNPINGKASLVERAPDPMMAAEVDPGSSMTAGEAAQLGAPAVDVSDDADTMKGASIAPPVKKERQMTIKVLKKGDPAAVLAQVKEAIGQLQDQAKEGKIDGALLDQAAAMMDVSFDTATAPTETPSGFTEATTPTPTVTPEAIPEATEETEKGTMTMTDGMTGTTETESEVTKNAKPPASYRPPTPNLIFDHAEDMRANLGKFVEYMEKGDILSAQRVAGNSGPGFDTMFNMATRAIMTEGGLTSENAGNMKKFSAPGATTGNIGDLRKSLTAASIPGVYLMKLAKLMMPLYAGIRNRMPVQTPTGMGSNQATWRAQLGFATSLASMMTVAEAATGTAISESFLTYNAPYRDTTANNDVTLKAIAASKGYDDPFQVAILQTMAALLQMEERNLIGSNYAAIAVPTSVTATGSTAGGTISAGSYMVGVTALSYYGWYGASTGSSASVVPIGETTATYYSGSANFTGSTGSIDVTWPAVPGAAAYNVYVSGNGSAAATSVYSKTVTINKTTITALPTAGGHIAPTADTSANAYGYEGLLSWCELAAVYGNTPSNKISITDMSGAGLTAQAGGIKEIDAVLANLWDTWQIAPTLLLMSSTMAQTVKQKLATGATGNYQMFLDISQNQGGFTGGIFPSGYTNNYAPFANGLPRRIDIIAHPYMPNGRIEFLSETVPYPMSREARGFTIEQLVPYTYFPLAQTTVKYPFALTLSETLACYIPTAQTAITGIDSTL